MYRLAISISFVLISVGLAGAAPYAVSGTTAGAAYSGTGELVTSGSALRVQRSAQQRVLRGQLTWTSGAWVGELRASGGASGALVPQPASRLRTSVTPADTGYRLVWTDAQGNTGEELWRVVLPAPQGLSPLATEVFAQAARVASKGTLPAELIASADNRVSQTLLETGPQIFAGYQRLIEGAEHEVLIQTYQWDTPCQAGDAILAGLKALEARRRQAQATSPVQVFLVVNKHWSLRKNLKRAERFAADANLDASYVNLRTAGFKQRLFGLVHTKAIVVDGARAIVTSANVHPPQDTPDPWFELGYQVEGPLCTSLRAEFANLWRCATDDALPAAPPPVAPAFTGGVPVAVATRAATGNPISRRKKAPTERSLVSAFRSAQQRIRILSPQLNDKILLHELAEAARRGVAIQVVLSKDKGNFRLRLPFQGGTNVKALRRLRKSLKNEPAALARLDLRWYSVDGQTPIEGNGGGANHAKYCTVDGELAIVGSTNHDAQSMKYSREIALVVADPATVQAWDRQVFEPAQARGITVQ